MKFIDVIGLPVAAINYASAVTWIQHHARKGDRAYAVEAANTHVAALARHDVDFGAAMGKFDLICPDGMPLVWSVNRGLEKVEKLGDRVYGPTLMLKSIEASGGESDLKHYLLGGSQSTLDKLNENFAKNYPDTEISRSYGLQLIKKSCHRQFTLG